MGKRSLGEQLKQASRNDPARGPQVQPATTCRLWAAPRLMSNGGMALGFYPHRDFGPVVQLVENSQFALFYDQFLKPGGQYFKDAAEVNDILNRRDSAVEAFNQNPNRRTEINLAEANAAVGDLEKALQTRDQAEQLFASRNVREFVVLNHDGTSKIDYNHEPDRWEGVVIGGFGTAQYCYMKSASGGPAAEAAASPVGGSIDDIESIRNFPTQLEAKLANLRDPSGFDSACPRGFTTPDGAQIPLNSKYPIDGDLWLATIRHNARKKAVSFFRSLGPDGLYLDVNDVGAITMRAPTIHIDVDPRAISIGDYQENPLQTSGPSNAVTPVSRFRPRILDLNFTSGVYDAVKEILDELGRTNNADYRETFSREHEVVDYNDFVPPSREV